MNSKANANKKKFHVDAAQRQVIQVLETVIQERVAYALDALQSLVDLMGDRPSDHLKNLEGEKLRKACEFFEHEMEFALSEIQPELSEASRWVNDLCRLSASETPEAAARVAKSITRKLKSNYSWNGSPFDTSPTPTGKVGGK